MAKIVIDLSMSLDGFIAGPHDDAQNGLGLRGGEHIFDWYTTGSEPSPYGDLFRPEGANVKVVEEMFKTVGAILTGRRTYDITHGWAGTHPINGIPIIVVTHEKPQEVPTGKSTLIFESDFKTAVEKAKEAAGDKSVGISGASLAQQALKAGLVDEIFVHIAPILLGDGVRLFDHFGDRFIRLAIIESFEGPLVNHIRYRVVK
ncbi:dihydrofolate reductase family protein [Larkinella ripae]